MKDIPGYEGKYAITSCGKVYSYRTKKFLKSCLDPRTGYYQVSIYDKDGKLFVKLEWCDAKYNCNYGTRNSRISQTRLNYFKGALTNV